MRLATLYVLMCILLSSCASQPPGEQFARQKIPVQIQSGKPVTINIHVTGSGVNDVGIRCSPEVWNALTNGPTPISVRLKSSNKEGVVISEVHPGSSGTSFLGYMPNVHYLFYIHGAHTGASVEIAFPNVPSEATSAEMIVCVSPNETL